MMRSSPPSDERRRAFDRKSTGDATGESSMKMVAASKCETDAAIRARLMPSTSPRLMRKMSTPETPAIRRVAN